MFSVIQLLGIVSTFVIVVSTLHGSLRAVFHFNRPTTLPLHQEQTTPKGFFRKIFGSKKAPLIQAQNQPENPPEPSRLDRVRLVERLDLMATRKQLTFPKSTYKQILARTRQTEVEALTRLQQQPSIWGPRTKQIMYDFIELFIELVERFDLELGQDWETDLEKRKVFALALVPFFDGLDGYLDFYEGSKYEQDFKQNLPDIWRAFRGTYPCDQLCKLDNQKPTSLQFCHILGKARGGSDRPENLELLHPLFHALQTFFDAFHERVYPDSMGLARLVGAVRTYGRDYLSLFSVPGSRLDSRQSIKMWNKIFSEVNDICRGKEIFFANNAGYNLQRPSSNPGSQVSSRRPSTP